MPKVLEQMSFIFSIQQEAQMKINMQKEMWSEHARNDADNAFRRLPMVDGDNRFYKVLLQEKNYWGHLLKSIVKFHLTDILSLKNFKTNFFQT